MRPTTREVSTQTPTASSLASETVPRACAVDIYRPGLAFGDFARRCRRQTRRIVVGLPSPKYKLHRRLPRRPPTAVHHGSTFTPATELRPSSPPGRPDVHAAVCGDLVQRPFGKAAGERVARSGVDTDTLRNTPSPIADGAAGCEHGRVNTRIKRLKVCLNGGRNREDHPAVPLTPAELAASAAAAVDAGAEAVHLHPRGTDGDESLLAADVSAAVTAVRQACPGTPVGVSTGLWITGGDPAARQSAVAAWSGLPAATRPDFASINLSEPGWTGLCSVLASAGIAAEAGIWSEADADQLAAAGQTIAWLRILVEIINVPPEKAVAAADVILQYLDELNATIPRMLHGEGPACWPLIAHAGALGLPTRIGLEDTLAGPDGSAVSGNAELVQLALQTWRSSAAP